MTKEQAQEVGREMVILIGDIMHDIGTMPMVVVMLAVQMEFGAGRDILAIFEIVMDELQRQGIVSEENSMLTYTCPERGKSSEGHGATNEKSLAE